MKLLLKRKFRNEKNTIGELFVDNIFECLTCEDKEREIEGKPVSTWKIPAVTAIPKGTYNVIITYSNRFKKDLPLLEGVEGFSGVRIHTGNTDQDTEGCILTGRMLNGVKGEGGVGASRTAFTPLFDKIQTALKAGDKVTITIL